MNSHFDCGEAGRLLPDYGAGRLGTAEAARVEAHMEACPACRAAAAAQEAVWAALDDWRAPAPSSDFDFRLARRMEREISWWDRMVRAWRPLTMKRALPVAAAGLALAAVFLAGRPAPVRAPEPAAQVEALRPDQADAAIEDMEMLHELMRADAAEPRL
jgi:anti-sigma factor RsiW